MPRKKQGGRRARARPTAGESSSADRASGGQASGQSAEGGDGADGALRQWLGGSAAGTAVEAVCGSNGTSGAMGGGGEGKSEAGVRTPFVAHSRCSYPRCSYTSSSIYHYVLHVNAAHRLVAQPLADREAFPYRCGQCGQRFSQHMAERHPNDVDDSGIPTDHHQRCYPKLTGAAATAPGSGRSAAAGGARGPGGGSAAGAAGGADGADGAVGGTEDDDDDEVETDDEDDAETDVEASGDEGDDDGYHGDGWEPHHGAAAGGADGGADGGAVLEISGQTSHWVQVRGGVRVPPSVSIYRTARWLTRGLVTYIGGSTLHISAVGEPIDGGAAPQWHGRLEGTPFHCGILVGVTLDGRAAVHGPTDHGGATGGHRSSAHRPCSTRLFCIGDLRLAGDAWARLKQGGKGDPRRRALVAQQRETMGDIASTARWRRLRSRMVERARDLLVLSVVSLTSEIERYRSMTFGNAGNYERPRRTRRPICGPSSR